MKALQSQLLAKVPGLVHGFGTWAEPVPASLQAVWDERRPSWKQVHGVGISEASEPRSSCGEVDAIWTRNAGIPIAVVTADCVPVLLARRDGKAAAAVHAGWRGTWAGILRNLWETLRSQGEDPGTWIAAVGPAIGPCCYEVSEELAADFSTAFASFGKKLAVPRHRILDLPAINAEELRRIGVGEVDLLRACTRCSKDPVSPAETYAFHSYRREGGGTRQYSMILLT